MSIPSDLLIENGGPLQAEPCNNPEAAASLAALLRQQGTTKDLGLPIETVCLHYWDLETVWNHYRDRTNVLDSADLSDAFDSWLATWDGNTSA